MKGSYPGINPDISEWKGQEITDFQEDLLGKVNAHVSEKWFYTHMKADRQSLPRIDVLNLLSRYAGYLNWDDFIFSNRENTTGRKPIPGANRYFYLVPLIALLIVAVLYGAFRLFNTREYCFRFYDSDTREPVKNMKIAVRLLPEGESPVDLVCDSTGAFRVRTDKSLVRMVVTSPYYQSDTIKRIIRKIDGEESISLHANDYALMIHYFSKVNVADWKTRREKLEEIIEDSAMICQVINDRRASGLELLTKQEFIDKLTVPSGSLKNLEVLDTRYRNNRISVLRFRVNMKNE